MTTEFINNIVKDFDHEDFYFMQIGASDGITADPIYSLIKQYDWSGIMFEPQEKSFYQLKINYYNRDTKIHFVNAAISDKDEKKKLYKCKYRGKEIEQLSSLVLRNSDKNNIYFDENYFNTINCLTFETAIRKYKIKKIDLLLVDTEGYDNNIIQMFPFEQFKPKVVQFENWPHDFDDKNNSIKDTGPIGTEKSINILKQYKYSISYVGSDILGVLNED